MEQGYLGLCEWQHDNTITAASISLSTSFGTFIKYLIYINVYCIFDFFLVSVDRKVLRPGVLVGPNIVDSHIWKSFQNRPAKDYTMSCEQTFVWLSRFKKVVYVKHKTHHFYIHRMVKRRNSYIEYCYMNNRRPLLPKPKSGSVQQMNICLYCTCVFTLSSLRTVFIKQFNMIGQYEGYRS